MSLTQDDLQSIKTIIDDAFDASDQRTAAGFAEVHEKLAQHDEQFTVIRADLNRIESKLDATIDQVEDHEVRIGQLETKPA